MVMISIKGKICVKESKEGHPHCIARPKKFVKKLFQRNLETLEAVADQCETREMCEKKTKTKTEVA